MPLAFLPDLRLNYLDEGTGAPVVFSHALGLDLTMWDAVLPHLPKGLRILRYDHRGHGGSDVPAPPYAMGALVRDAERLLDHLGVRDCVFVGLSMGGLVAQGLAIKRLDLVRGLVLSNTAARIGNDALWQARSDTVATGGIEALADATMERWFPPPLPRRGAAPALARAIAFHIARWLSRRLRGDWGGRFLYAHRQPDLAHAGDRRVRGRIDPARSCARNGRVDPGGRVHPDARVRPPAPD